MPGNIRTAGQGCDVMREICYRFKAVKEKERPTYSNQLQVSGVKREKMVNWVESEVKELFLRAEDEKADVAGSLCVSGDRQSSSNLQTQILNTALSNQISTLFTRTYAKSLRIVPSQTISRPFPAPRSFPSSIRVVKVGVSGLLAGGLANRC